MTFPHAPNAVSLPLRDSGACLTPVILPAFSFSVAARVAGLSRTWTAHDHMPLSIPAFPVPASSPVGMAAAEPSTVDHVTEAQAMASLMRLNRACMPCPLRRGERADRQSLHSNR
jgi:hypothetical protein